MKIAVASGKGGTGKTILSVNLAAYLSEFREVVLTDLDVEEPNAGLFLHAKQEEEKVLYKYIPSWDEGRCTLCGKCQQYCNFHAIIRLGDQIMVFNELCHSCYACSELCPRAALPMKPRPMGTLQYRRSGRLHFVEGKLDIGQEQAVPVIAQTKEFTDERWGSEAVKIYDAPPGTSCPVIEACKDADYVILVTEPTPFGFHDLQLAVETMRGMKREFGVVINRYGLGREALIEDYCQLEKINILARIPNQREIAELYAGGQLIGPEIPEMRHALENIGKSLLKFKVSAL